MFILPPEVPGIDYVLWGIFSSTIYYLIVERRLLILLLYALIPGISAVILRIILKKAAYKFIVVFATAIGVVCVFAHIFFAETFLSWHTEHRLFSIQFILPISVSVLYCVAFFGKGRKIWIALLPAVAYLLNGVLFHVYESVTSLGILYFDFINFYDFYGFIGAAGLIWALFCILVTYMTDKFIKRRKNKEV